VTRLQHLGRSSPKNDPNKTRSSADIFGRTVAIIALLISLFTFALQFVGHDAVSYLISHVSTTAWPTNGYVTVSLSVFNRGNRPAALISATADRVEMKVANDQQKVTDSDCQTPHENKARRFTLFPVSKETGNPILASVYKYSTSLEAGKLLTENLIFSIFSGDNVTEKDVEGIVCLKLNFADSKGAIYDITRALQGIYIPFQQLNLMRTPAADFLGEGKSLIPVTVVDHRRIELPF
jgi:hypothetical protein